MEVIIFVLIVIAVVTIIVIITYGWVSGICKPPEFWIPNTVPDSSEVLNICPFTALSQASAADSYWASYFGAG